MGNFEEAYRKKFSSDLESLKTVSILLKKLYRKGLLSSVKDIFTSDAVSSFWFTGVATLTKDSSSFVSLSGITLMIKKKTKLVKTYNLIGLR